MTTSELRSRDGLPITSYRVGDGPETIVIVNAPGMSIRFWLPVVQALQGAYTVVGFGSGYPNNFSEHTYEHVVFPALPAGVKNCAACHGDDNDSWHAPADREHPTEQVDPVLEWRMVCGSCHDGDGAVAHMGTQSDPMTGLEACSICHGIGEELEVELVHKPR